MMLVPRSGAEWVLSAGVCVAIWLSCWLPWLVQNWLARRWGAAAYPMPVMYRLGLVACTLWFVFLIGWRVVVIVRGHW